MTTQAKPLPSTALEPLFVLELQVRPDAQPLTSAEGRVGQRIGGGDGSFAGERLAGTLQWDLYERGGVVTGEPRCAIDLAGILTTHDGAAISFDARGYGLVPDPAAPRTWRISAVMQFHTDDERYAWLNGLLAPWQGGIDLNTGRARYQVFA